nr:hypothetical protein [Streptomyces griseus]
MCRAHGGWGARGAGLGLGVLWWWAVLRIALVPDAGVLEGAVAVGGWGLSLLPVHCVARSRAVGALGAGRWVEAWRGSGGVREGAEGRMGGGEGARGVDGGRGCAESVTKARGVDGGRGCAESVTKASPRRRWGGGSGPS